VDVALSRRSGIWRDVVSELDPVIHAPHRLRLCSILAAVDDADFVTLRNALGVADSVLSKHVATLTEAGYVSVRKSSDGGKRSTWISLTRSGRKALKRHVAILQQVIDTANRPRVSIRSQAAPRSRTE
jgi:DNA-binding MarR family transcriptional regulator